LAEKAFSIREFQQLELFEKISLLFERMELSQGWKDLSKKLGRTNTSLTLHSNKNEINHSQMSQKSFKNNDEPKDLNQLKEHNNYSNIQQNQNQPQLDDVLRK